MNDKTTKDLVFRLSEIEREKFKLDLEYNKIVQELWDRIPSLKDDVNLQPKETLEILIDKLMNETYQDGLGEYTRIFPLNNCCRERLNIVKKKVRKYEINRFVSENK